jgi:hypothetical protein
MIDFIKRILGKIGWILLGIIVVAIALCSALLGLGSVAEIVVKIVSIAGGGSVVLGIIISPFFVFGAIQLFRGACKVFDADLKKMNEQGESLWHYLYIPATILGYIAFIVVLMNVSF